MKRWLVIGFISCYLGILGYGVGCHTMGYAVSRHPLMYFIIWDMFCGWASYTTEIHVIGEGESQKYYELAPGPWGEFKPWGSLDRHHYDNFNNHMARVAMNTLKHTRHEPMTRIFVVEESWPKRFDLPDEVWKYRYGDEPKVPQKYHHLRAEITPDGFYARTYNAWLADQGQKALAANPRLQADAARSRPVIVTDRQKPDSRMPDTYEQPRGESSPALFGGPAAN